MALVKTDVIIAGGGLVGATLAHALAHGGLESVVVDSLDLPLTLDPVYDGRASAIASASVRMMETIGLWPRLSAHAQPIREIRVTDGSSPLFLHFDGRPMGDEPLGQMIENRHIRFAQLGSLAEGRLPIQLHAPARLLAATRGAGKVTAHLSTGVTLEASLIVSCEGRGSRLRGEAHIRCVEWPYHQDAVIVTVAHRDPHGAIAHERFLPDGPFAILPMVDDEEGRHRSAIVLTVREGQGALFLTMCDERLLAEVSRRFGDFLGPLSLISRRWSYPLGLMWPETIVAPRLALVGDSAHGIHPIAGQGLNLGFRDVAALAQVLCEAAYTGQDLGSPGVLARYARWRRTDIMVMMAATDGLNRLFSNDNGLVRRARRLGLGAVNRLPPLRRLFMAHARGNLGQLPKLLQGVALSS
jgi:2-octaprenyl-6-methoxyphenol hydroxylase